MPGLPGPGQRGRGYLHRATQFHPTQDSLRRCLQNRVTLRMGNHRSETCFTQPGGAVIQLHRDTVVVQFHQQIMAAFDGVALRPGQDVLYVFIREVEIAAQAQLWSLPGPLAEIGEDSYEIFAIVVVALVGMRRRDNVLDAVGRRNAAHFLRRIQDLGPSSTSARM
jgi:hypothetical protein